MSLKLKLTEQRMVNNMDPQFQEQVAAFRYSLIAPIVSRQTPMGPGEISLPGRSSRQGLRDTRQS